MTKLSIFGTALLALLLTVSSSFAATTSVGVNVSRGQEDSMAYSLNIMQKYEPWVANENFEIAPLVEIGGHAWVPDDSDDDTVWGGYLAPGLRITINTSAPIRPYLEGSVGGALNSEDEIDSRKLGSHVLFRTRGTVGVSFGDEYRHRVQGDFVHYSNWGLANKNDGYDTYGISYGYSF